MADVTLSSIVGGGGGGGSGLPSATSLQSREAGALVAAPNSEFGGTFTASATPSAWVSVLSLSTAGILFYAGVLQSNATSKTVGIRVTIDGVVVATRSRATPSATATNGVLVGAVNNPRDAAAYLTGGFAPFQTLLIEANSSVASDTASAWFANYVLL